MSAENEVNVLQLTLHGRLVGYLAGFSNGRNVLSFAEEFGAGGRTSKRVNQLLRIRGQSKGDKIQERRLSWWQLEKQIFVSWRADEVFHEGKRGPLQSFKG